MALWRAIAHGLRALVSRGRAERDLTDEVEHFLAAAEADLIAGGATPAEARRAVRLRYGDPMSAREDLRSGGWEHLLEETVGDVRVSARNLRRSPAFTLVVVLTLGLGVGAATIVFSAASPVLMDPLGYPGSERIVSMSDRSSDGAPVQVTFGTYRELAARTQVFESTSVFKAWQPTLTSEDEPRRLKGLSVSAAYFDVLGVAPVLGPGFDAEADRPGAPRSVLLADALWRDRFGADPAVVGRDVRLDGEAVTVVGVMPATFHDANAPLAEVWTLLRYDPLAAGFDTREWGHNLDMIGRLRPGSTLDEARADLSAIASRPQEDFIRPDWAALTQGITLQRLGDAVTADVRPTLLILVGAVALLIVVTCANLTILILARGARRESEFEMRMALGAGRGRLARYLLVEGVLLAGAGGLLGLTIARTGLTMLLTLSPAELPGLDRIGVGGASLAFALGLTGLVGILFGLAPGLHHAPDGSPALRDSGRSAGRRSRATRRALVVAEVALATVLLVGTGLVVQSTRRLFDEPLGLDPSGVVVMQVVGSGLEPGDAVADGFFDRALDAVRAVPGVGSAATTSQLPLSGDQDVYGVVPDEPEAVDGALGPAYRFAVTPGYFATLGVTVQRGRALADEDVAGAPPVAVVSNALARRLFQGGEPLGRRIRIGAPEEEPYTVVGVVEDVKHTSLAADRAEAVYVTTHQWRWADRVRWLVVRGTDDAESLLPALRRAVWSADGAQPIVRAQSMQQLVARSEARRRFVLVVLAAFASAALAVAVVGLYGVVSTIATERTREMGVRAALGASREQIVGIVVRRGMGLTAAGVALGLLGAGWASRALTVLLYEVSPVDPPTYLGVAALLGLAAAVACGVPAVRAGRADPVDALRSEA